MSCSIPSDFFNQTSWPLVWSYRYNDACQIIEDQEIIIRELKEELAEAMRNDHRNSITGRYEKPLQLVTDGA